MVSGTGRMCTNMVRMVLGAHNLSGLVAHDLSGSHAFLRRKVYEPDRTVTGDQTVAILTGLSTECYI